MNIITASMDNRDIQPHAAFQHVSPDDVMNCWDEADMAICRILWKGHEVYVEMTSGQNSLNVMAARHQKADDEWWQSIQAPYEN